MASDLNFFDYKRAVVEATLDLDDFSKASQSVFLDTDDSVFYRLSFYNRGSAELEYQLLNMLAKADNTPENLKNRIDQYIEHGARFLLRDAEIADNTAEAKKYRDKITEFDKRRQSRCAAVPVPASLSEWEKSVEKFYEDMQDYLSTPFHVSKIITLLSYINLYRLLSVFSRLAFKSFWTVASQRQWIDGQDRLLGYPLQRAALDIPKDVLNILSVALFLMRLAARFSVILKHGRSLRPGERDINAWDRVAREFSTCMVDIMNDGVWWWVNALTNFGLLSDPVSNALLAVTLVYDCTWLAIHWYRKERDLLLKQEELINWSEQKRPSNGSDKTITQYANDKKIIELQLTMLKDMQWEIRCKYAFTIVACLSIITSYLLFLAAISAAVSTVCLFICVVSFAMYGSADEFGGWMRAEFGELKLQNERDTIRAKFFKNFTQAFCSPVLVMGLMAFSWQVAFLAAAGAFMIQYLPEKWEFGNRRVVGAQSEAVNSGTSSAFKF